MADREIRITAKYDGKQAEADAKSSFEGMGKTAQKGGTMVNEGMGKAMSQFNEKTEKGRQLMTAFGGAMGQAGGQVTYYAGTISYVIGRFKLWELGTMAAIGAIVMLGKALYDATEGPIQKLLDDTKKLREETDKLAESMVKMADDAIASAAKLTSFDLKRHELLMKRVDLENKLLKLQEERARFEGAEGVRTFTGKIKELDEAIAKTEISLGGLDFAMSKLGTAEAAKKRASAKSAPGGAAGGSPGLIGLLLGSGVGIKEAIAFNAKVIEAEAEYQSIQLMNELRETQLKEFDAYTASYISRQDAFNRMKLQREFAAEDEITKNLEREQKLRENMQEKTIRNSISLFEEMGELFAQNEEQRKAVRIAAIIAQAAYEAAMEVAAGFANIERPWVAAAHFTAAALYGAVAAGKVSDVVKEKDKSVGEREARQGGRNSNPWKEEKKEMTIVVQLGGREAGRAVFETLEGYRDNLNPNRPNPRVGY